MEQQITKLFFLFDLSVANKDFALSDDLKADTFQFTQEDFNQHAPSFEDRCTVIAYEAYFFAIKKKYPQLTPEQFAANLDAQSLKTTIEAVSQVLSPTVTFEQLKEYQRVKSLNLTQVDKDRQVK